MNSLLLAAFLYIVSPSDILPYSINSKTLKIRDTSKVSYQECDISAYDRIECGFLGIEIEECQSRGCCWQPSDSPGAYWCYHSSKNAVEQCVAVDHEEKVDCGYYGINSRECTDGGCCWMPTQRPNTPWCFFPTGPEPWSGECGIPAIMPSVDTRIVGGETAIPHSWPWQISMNVQGRHWCGGSLINNRWVVTAAHCGPGVDIEDDYLDEVVAVVRIVLGAHNKDVSEDTQVKARIENIFTYPGYNSSTIDNDIMLIKLEEDAEFNDDISPVCLPPAGEELSAQTIMQTTGWGNLEYGGEAPAELQQLTLPVWDNAECEERGVNLAVNITDNMICAGYMEEGRSSCHGDSGGPLVKLVNGKWTLFGVVSWGYLCGADDHAGLYAKVINYLDWIEDTMENN